MRKNTGKSDSLITSIFHKFQSARQNSLNWIRNSLDSRKTIEKVEKKLAVWIDEGKHHEPDISMDDILDDLGLTRKELSFYCSHVLKTKFLTWRKTLRINEAKELLLKHPNTPACHIGFAVGLYDKSNFKHQFRELVGCTPTEWRKRNLKEYDHADE